MITTKNTLVLLFIGFLLSNCTDTTSFSKNDIQNTWVLEKVIGGLQGLDLDYSGKEVNFTFYNNNTVKIENHTAINSQFNTYVGFATGTYSYELKHINNEKVLYINDIKQGKVTIVNKKLRLDDNLAADGFLKTFQLFYNE